MAKKYHEQTGYAVTLFFFVQLKKGAVRYSVYRAGQDTAAPRERTGRSRGAV